MSSPEEVKGESAEPEPAADQAEHAQSPAAEAGEPGEGDLRPLDVYMVLRASVAQFSSAAWQMLGLQPDPFTGKLHKDIEQARTAIDVTAFLVEKLLPSVQGQEARDYQNLLTDLRLNFVRQAGEQT
jgi:hypothetical protein